MAACDGDQRGVDLAMYCLLGNDLISDRAAHPAAIPMPPATCVCDTPGCIEQGQSVLREANRVGLLPVVKQSVFVHNTSTFPILSLANTSIHHARTCLHTFTHTKYTRAHTERGFQKLKESKTLCVNLATHPCQSLIHSYTCPFIRACRGEGVG